MFVLRLCRLLLATWFIELQVLRICHTAVTINLHTTVREGSEIYQFDTISVADSYTLLHSINDCPEDTFSLTTGGSLTTAKDLSTLEVSCVSGVLVKSFHCVVLNDTSEQEPQRLCVTINVSPNYTASTLAFVRPSYTGYLVEEQNGTSVSGFSDFYASVSPLGPISSLQYRISPPNAQFEIVTEEVACYKYPKIVPIGPLDREESESYLVTVEAFLDENTLPRISTDVRIHLVDVNDNAPTFVSTSYQVISISELITLGTQVARVSAVDHDAGSNAVITYTLRNPSNTFVCDPITGNINILAPLDYESDMLHTLTVVAHDSGIPSLSTDINITINVVDMNEMVPLIQLPAMPVFLSATSMAVTITVDDSDSTSVSLSKSGRFSESFELRQLSPFQFELILTSFAGLSSDTIDILLTAVDDGVPLLTSTAALTVRVPIGQDQLPSGFLLFEIVEGVPIGSYVGRVELQTDVEAYRIINGNTPTWFSINSAGDLTTVSNVDHETATQFNLTIEVTLSGEVTRLLIALIDVIDINDNSPHFLSNITTTSVSESADIIFTFSASDSDDGCNGAVHYYIQYAEPDVFTLDSLSGTLSPKYSGAVDYERFQSARVSVKAVDQAIKHPQSSETLLEITITNINDHAPVITPIECPCWVMEEDNSRQECPPITAYDLDIDGSSIRFSIQSGNNRSAFGINENTGLVFTRGHLDHEIQDVYDLAIVASDGFHNSLPVILTIIVIDINDSPPTYASPPLQFTIAENHEVGKMVASVAATHSDAGYNALTNYNYAAETSSNVRNTFMLDPASGWLFLQAPLSATGSSYNFTVQAVDRSQSTQSTSVVVEISVSPPPNKPPQFLLPEEHRTVASNSPVGTHLFRAVAFDPDGHGLSYAIMPAHNRFDIDENTGLITSALSLSETDYNLVIVATDNDSQPLSASMRLQVSVYNPTMQFNSATYTHPVSTELCHFNFSLSEEATNNAAVHVLTPSSSQFSLIDNEFSASFYTDGNVLRFRGQSASIFTELASIPLNLRRINSTNNFDICSITINIIDVNNNPPRFVQPSSMIEIYRSTPVGSVVFQAVAVDQDKGSLAVTSYSLTGSSNFEIDAITGFVSVSSSLTNSANQHSLVITATDGERITLTDQASLTVTLLGNTNNPPTFTSSATSFTVSEARPVGFVIHTLETNDNDPGVYGRQSYCIASGDPQHFFSVQSDGDIVINQMLDRESLTQASYQLMVVSYDQSPNPNSTPHSITINVTETNDETPTFLSTSYAVCVYEDIMSGSEVVALTAIDRDPDAAGMIAYSLVNNMGRFEISSSGGVISTTSALDREETANYQLTVVATDGGTPQQSGSVVVSIEVIDRNDNSPQFIGSTVIQRMIGEDTVVGSTVLQLTARDDDDGLNGEIVFSVQAAVESPFALDPVSGLITVSRSLDYETAPAGGYLLQIRATDRGSPPRSSGMLTLTLRIRDHNEMPPQFENTSYSFMIPESSATGVPLFNISAVDSDRGSSVEYSLIERQVSDSVFQIHQTTGSIQLRRALDRNALPFHQLEISATDSGSPQLTSSALVHVEIIPTSIASPLFRSPYFIQVVEDTPVNSSVLWMHAEGYDPANPGNIVYSIMSGDANTWAIVPTTGVLYLRSSLNYSLVPEYNLTVRANRDGAPSDDVTRVTIQVLPTTVDLLPPTFDLNSNFVIRVTGDTTASEPFATLRAIGMPPFQYYIDGGTGLGLFMLSDVGELSTRLHPLSLLPSIAYTLTATVQDNNGLEDTREFIVDVSDLNHSPWFTSPVYHTTVRESVTNTIIACVTAEDKDTGANGMVRYSIINVIAGQFAVDSITGEVSILSDPLNYEISSEVRMLIQATDGGSLNTTTLMVITVEDVNDRRPQIQPSDAITINVFNNCSPDRELMRLFVSDQDSSINREVRYTSSSNNYFFVNATTGAIMKTSATLNVGDTITVGVSAQNVAQPPLTSVRNITLTINVVLPMPQATLTITPNSATVNVREDIPVASVIYNVNATGSNLVMYGFIETQSHFTIHPNTGEVYVAASLDREQQSSYDLLIEVSAGGSNRDVLILTVTVDNVNDNVPQFNQTVYQFMVTESVSVGYMVGTVNAVDFDNVTYSIVQGRISLSAATFEITSTGQILTTQLLDREQLAVHELIIEASDGSSFDRAMIIVTVMDENDFTPTFTRSSYTVTVAEDTRIGTIILTVNAFDLDQGTNGIINYQSTSSHFSVNTTTGDVILMSSLDYENTSRHSFNVDASDTESSSSVLVTVLVSDVPDNPPQLCNLAQTVSVRENLLAFTPVASIDICGREALVRFNITSGNELDHFVVDPSSGIIFSTIVLDREQVEQYTLGITAVHTTGGPSGGAQLTITIEDENDNLPQLNPPIVVVDVSEASLVSTILYTFNITDRDSGDNGDVSVIRIYNFPATMYFTIDTAGRLMLRRPLDRENLFKSIRFQMYIYDSGTPPQAAGYSVTVNVLDVNEPPDFTSDTYTILLATPVLVGTRLLFVVAVDHDDAEFGSLQYSISGGNGSEHFNIDPQSGGITVSNNFLMQPVVYHLVVTATDGGRLQDTCDVFISTQECPDSTLLFQPSVDTVSVFENASLNTVLYMPVLLNLGVRNNDGIDFSFSIKNSAFAISLTSGIITLDESLDREAQPSYQLTIQALDESTSRLAVSYVTVIVLDVNDNSPIFQNTPLVAFIEDSIAVGSSVTLVSAIDRDIGSNAEIVYSLPSENLGLFSINATTGEIKTIRTLNGVSVTSPIQLTVQAQDAGEIPLSSEAIVSVHVMDSRAPLFSPLTYTANVSENAMIGTPVITVSAVSRSGIDGTITYTIEDGDDLSQFMIGAVSGEVSVHMSLDYEITQEYRLELQALDMSASLSTITFLVITIIDANDNRPVFSEAIYSASVLENATVGTMLTQVAAMDIDAGVNKEINYQLPSNSYPGVFRVDPQTGWVSLSGGLDRELACSNLHQNQQCIYNFPVEAVDEGTPPLTGTAQVRVAVGNVNDNSPEFTRSVYIFSVEDDETIGENVGLINAIDIDRDDVQYFIDAGGDGSFILDPNSGQLTLNTSFSDTDPVEYLLNVSACDPFLLCGSARVSISVTDINNHFPIFTEAVYEANVPENVVVGEPFFTISATDGDRGLNAAILYTIQDSFAPFFMINNRTGEISAVASLDRETRSFYELLVFAVDGGGLSGAATIRLTVADINDNAPQFSLSSYQISIPEVLPANSVFLRVNAEDSDAGENGSLSYSIVPPAGTELSALQFRINSLTGEISVRLMLIGPMVINFSVAVSDRGMPPLSGAAVPVSVTILDANRSPPIFSEPFYNASVLEEQPSGTFVLNVIATAINNTVVFEFLNRPQQFMIFGNNGTIVTRRVLDREEEDEYELQVRATVTYNDGTFEELNSFVQVYIRVTDVNERPEFIRSVYRVSIFENAPIMSVAVPTQANITGEDRDLGDNGEIRYQLRSNNDPFYINPVTGILLVNGTLDFETTISYTLTVDLQDLGSPPQTSLIPATVLIFVRDENDSPPVFPNATYYVELYENATANSEVIVVTATDADSEPNSVIFYSLNETSIMPTFVIDSSTGAIRLSSSPSLDRETVDHLELTIIASDARNPDDAIHTGNATLSVTILDVDDEPPVFNLSQYNFEVEENYPVGQVFFQVTAMDPDIGGNSLIAYSLIDGSVSNNFTINATTGQISFAVLPDHEALGTMNFVQVVIRASDPGGREGQTSLVVSISDLNDNYPIFSSTQYTGTVVEHSEENDNIVRVMATDADDLQNGQIFYTLFGNQNFSVVRETGVVNTSAVLDREQRSSYTLTVEARDMGTPSLATNVTVNIVVTDINDNSPEFSQNLYQVEVSESVQVNSLVKQITAVDIDEGANANLSYALIGDNTQQFTVESYTGRLLVVRPLNYELTRSYNITLQASDGGSPPRTDTTIVNITVLDANDNHPIFQPLQCPCEVEENATVPHIITVVTATDLDSGMNAVIQYSIFEPTKSPEIGINSTTGEIFIASSLNYETRREFDLTIMAIDMGMVQNTASVGVVINVIDINDNPPQFIPMNVTATVRENLAVDQTPILTLVAEDADSVSDITYSIISGNEDNRFALDRQNGVLQATVSFDREERSSYVLVVTAEDNGSPSLTGTSYVTVQIIDVDDSRPSDAQTHVFIYRYQRNASPQVLGRVYIEDPDVNNTFSYRLLSGPSDVLTISNGIIFYPNRPPAVGEYILSVMVQDITGSAATSTVRILIVDVGEDMLREAVQLQLIDIRDSKFAHENYIRLRRAVASRLEMDVNMIHLFSLQPSVDRTGWLDVQLAIQNSSGDFLRRKIVEHFLHKFRSEIMLDAGVEIFTERADLCASEPCSSRGEGSNIVQFSDDNLLISRLSVILLGVSRTHRCQCNCLPGYSGNTCEHGMFDFCHSRPCPEIANCSNTLDGYECSCPQGTILDDDTCMPMECDSLICENGGSCGVTSNGLMCACPPSFVGDSCEIPLDIADVCADDKPCLRGNCTFSHVGHTCTCPVGFTGNDCGSPTSTNNSGCFQNPCQHGGTCIPEGNGISFDCNCPPGYTGEQCETFLYVMEDKEANDEEVSCQENSCSANKQCVVRDNSLSCVRDDCNSSTCFNGGTCYPQFPGFYCFCPDGFDGPRCEKTLGSFSGDSSAYAVFSSTLQQQLNGSIHLEFVTMSSSGLLLYTGRFDDEFLDVVIIQLTNSTLQLTVSYGGALTLLSPAVRVSDGVWHQIDIQHNSTHVVLRTDGCSISSQPLAGGAPSDPALECQIDSTDIVDTFHALDLGAPIILGGLPTSLGYASDQVFVPFTGCLRNVKVNDDFVDFSNPIEENGLDVEACALLDGPCQSSPCSNGATCIGLGNSFQCRCPVQFSGELCEEQAPSATFSGSNYIQYELKTDDGTGGISRRQTGLQSFLELEILLAFRANKNSGTILELRGQNDYAVLQVIDGGIQFLYNLGSGEKEAKIYENLLDDQFHYVTVTLLGKQAQLLLDNRLVAMSVASGNSQVLDIDPNGMFVGGTPSAENVVLDGFDGCLWGLQFNGYSVPFTNIEHEIFASVTPSDGIVHSCPGLELTSAPFTLKEEGSSVLFHVAIAICLLLILFLSIILVVSAKLLNHYCISRRGKFVIGTNISIIETHHRRGRSHSVSLENVRPYHEGGGESDNDEFSFHELCSIDRPFTELQETVEPQSPLRNGIVKRTPEHIHEPSGSQLSDAYTMSAASALDVTPNELNLPTLHEQPGASSAAALDTSATRLLEDNQSPRIYEQPVPTILANENAGIQHLAPATATAAVVTPNEDAKLNEFNNFITQKIAAANEQIENTNYDEMKVYSDEGDFDPLGSLGSLYNMNMEDNDDETLSLQSFSHLAEYGSRFQKINRILQRQDSSTGDDASVAASSVVFSRERLQQEPYYDRDVRIV